MKLAGIWTVFNGLDLLQDSVNKIANELDEIIVIDQDVSFHGEKPEARYELEQEHTHLEYKCDPKLNPKVNEKKKHTQAVTHAMRMGCTHFILLATDHFYEPNEFKRAKEFIKEYDYDTSATKLWTYYRTTEYRLDPLENYYCPFISKITKGWHFGNKYPVYVDPALQYSPHKKIIVFDEREIVLHHLSWVRSLKEIQSKIRNAASKENWKGKGDKILDEWLRFNPENKLTYYPDHELKKVPAFQIKNK